MISNFNLSIGVTYMCNSNKIPSWKFYLLDKNNNVLSGEGVYNNIISHEPHAGIPEDKYILQSAVDIDDEKEQEYTLVVEHCDAQFPQDYNEGDFGIEITHLEICDVDLQDLIHRRGHVYLDCSNNPNYIINLINDDNFTVEVLPHERDKTHKNYRLLNYRHSNVVGNNPKVFNNKTNESIDYTGYLITDNNYIIKGTDLYYDTTDDLYFIAEHCNNDNLYVEGSLFIPKIKYTSNENFSIENVKDSLHGSKLIHHIPNSACLSLNGRWEFKFKTPLYGWITDNIFGNDLK